MGMNVVLRAERPFVQSVLGALIDDGALVAREGSPIFLAFEKILTDLGANLFENKADMCRQRVVAQHGMPGLEEIVRADRGQHSECYKRDRQEDRP